MNRHLWIVTLVIAFQLGVGVGLLASKFFLREDPATAFIKSLEISGPQLQWQQ